MRKIIPLATLLPLNAIAHPGHVEITTSSIAGFLCISVVGTFALYGVLSLAKEKLKR